MKKVCVGYISNSEPLYLNASINAMLDHDWVDKVVVLLTGINGDTHRSTDGKVITYRKDFGNFKFEKSIEDGGFDEVSARNFLIDRMYEQKCDWLLVCDSDEYFTYQTIDAINKADEAGATYIYIPCWPYIPIKDMFFIGNRIVNGLHDPHVRLIRGDIKAEFIFNEKVQCINKSAHCVMKFNKDRPIWIDGFYHLHMFASLNAKHERVLNSVRNKELDVERLIRNDGVVKIPRQFEILNIVQNNVPVHKPVDQITMINAYGSHVEIIDKLTKDKDIVVTEEGMGYHSTYVFLKNCRKLNSLEYNERFYTDMIPYVERNILAKKCEWNHLLAKDFTAIKPMIEECQLMFVDGGIIEFRHHVANMAFEMQCPTVVIHDWEHEKMYKYDYINVPSNYKRKIYEHKISRIKTAVFSINDIDIDDASLQTNKVCQ